jgi:beta-galactosidase
MYWQWKPEPSGLEALGFGLTSLTGERSPRTETAAQCAAAFNTPAGFDLSQPVPALNGIFVSRTADLWWHAAFKGEQLYAQSLYGAYRACIDAGIPVRWIHADHLARFGPEELKVLYVPAPVALSDRELGDLQRFAAQGGTLVSECCPGLFDVHGVLRENHTFLEAVFGLAQPDVDHHEIVPMVYPQDKSTSGEPAGFTGRYYRQDFGELKTGVRTLAVYEDGKPGLFEKDCGRGRAILVGSLVGAAVALSEDRGSANFITRWMAPAGYKLLSNNHSADQVLIRLHQNGPRLYVCAVNYSENARRPQLTMHGTFHLVDGQTGVRWIQDPPAIELNLEPKHGLIVVLIERKDSRMGEAAL